MKHVIGVIGAGYWGPNLIRNFSALSDCKVKWISDLNADRREHVKRVHHSVETTLDYNDILTDPEVTAVAVATPVNTHRDIAIDALNASKHVFVEKPLARSVQECEEMNATAEDAGLLLMVGHTFVYNDYVREMRNIIASGELGDVMYINMRRLNLGLFQQDINVAWDLAPHDISILLYLLREDPTTVSCHGSAHINSKIEDVTTMTVSFPSGCIAFVQSSWIDPKKTREVTVVGTRKMIVFDDTEPQEKIRIYDKRVEVPPHYDTYAEFHYSYHYGDVHIPFVRQAEPLRVETQHFLDCIENGEPSISSGREGQRVVRILESADASLKHGGAVVEYAPTRTTVS